jgi:hypothetical protein
MTPWLEDPFHQRSYKPTEFMGLPPELRQKILLETIDDTDMDTCHRADIAQWIGVLSRVSKLTNLDMKYVGAQWMKQKPEADQHLTRNQAAAPKFPSFDNVWRPHPTIKRGARYKKGRSYRNKCWYCSLRHDPREVICPPAREIPNAWWSLTKMVRNKKYVEETDRTMFRGWVRDFKE